MDRFILTQDETYADKLKEYGFKLISVKGRTYIFANQPMTQFEDFSIDTSKCVFTSKMRF